ncbi:antibiotic biosynthesis monooxygenase family protein [Paenarthrobacter sp. NPDC058040]|uniref:antibiotic biosynthesis monooxygenase family protein n=1 Tax=unclassified Paenarthrobacter TaxID=2634190 RepID=UPI0036DAF494
MIRSQLSLKPHPGCVQKVLDFYKDREILSTSMAQAGCLSAEIRVPFTEENLVVVSAVWESRSAYQSWLDNPARALSVTDLEPLLDHPDNQLGNAELSEVHDFRSAASATPELPMKKDTK